METLIVFDKETLGFIITINPHMSPSVHLWIEAKDKSHSTLTGPRIRPHDRSQAREESQMLEPYRLSTPDDLLMSLVVLDGPSKVSLHCFARAYPQIRRLRRWQHPRGGQPTHADLLIQEVTILHWHQCRRHAEHTKN